MNNRAIEGTPMRLVVMILVAAAVLSIGFYQVGAFTTSIGRTIFNEDVIKLVQSINSLRSSSDYGGISHVSISVPNGHELRFSEATDEITIDYSNGQHEVFEPGIDIRKDVTLTPGTHSLTLRYADLPQKAKEYTVYFTDK